MIKLALNDTAIILFYFWKLLINTKYLSEFYYQLFQIFKEQRIKNFSKLNTLNSQVMLLPDKEYLFLRSKVVELSRIELLTSCVQGRRSPSWAIAPHMLVLLFVIRLRFNLSDKIKKKWWVWVDLNHRPHPYQGCALTNWATDPNNKCCSLYN